MSTNGIKPEQIPVHAIRWDCMEAIPYKVCRGQSGRWSVFLDIQIKAKLPDGRYLICTALVRANGRQCGQKPRAPRTRKAT
jgi:hypothetical protein